MEKNVLITGAVGNLGTAVCNKFVSSGDRVFGTVRPGSEIVSKKIRFLEADLTNEEKSAQLIKDLKKQVTNLDVLVHLVGGFAMGDIGTTHSQDLLKMYSLNFLSTFNIVRPVYQWMKESGGGSIVLVGAKPALDGGGSQMLSYTLSKSSVIQFAHILNETGAQDRIHTSVIVPSIIDTPINREGMPNANYEDWVTPEDIAVNVLHLVSSEGLKLRRTVLRIYGNS